MDQNILQLAGATPQKQPRFVPLGTHRMFTGLVTSRSPLQEPGTRAESRFYGGRPDALWAGLNIELSVNNTYIRRPGHTLVCTLPCPAQSFYTFQAPLAGIRVLADAGVAANALVNPSFANGSQDWTLQTGWAVNQGVGPGSVVQPMGQFSATGTALIGNNTQIPCGPGQNLYASCQAYGEPGSTGTAQLEIRFQTSNGTFISLVHSSAVPVNNGWQTMTASGAAPANAAYATVTFSVYNSTSAALSWAVCNFFATNAGGVYDITTPNSPVLLFDKAVQAGQTYFQTVGSQVFMTDGVDLQKWDGTHLWNWGIVAPTNAPTLTFQGGAAPSTPTLTASAGGTLSNQGTYYVQVTWITPFGESIASAESFLAVPNNNQLVVSTPTNPPINATGWNVYIGTTSGGETLQTTTPVSTSLNFTLTAAPTTNGAHPPSTSSSATYSVTSPLGVSYVYCYQNGYTDHVSTASPVSVYTGPQTNVQITIDGQGSTDPQVSNVQIYRTTDGGATYYLLATIANPGSGNWSYTDTGTPDADLNSDIIAPQASANNPPPTGLQNLAYFQGCIWGSVGNYLYFSNGPLTTNGSGNESWPPLNYALLPSKITALVPYPNGMLIFTVDDTYYTTGPGATPILFQAGLGTLSYNNVDMSGSTIYVFTTDQNIVAITPGAGSVDLGWNVADNFSSIVGTGSYLTYHISGHADNALFLCDGAGNLWRCNPNQQPEGGATWSPNANIAAGATAICSVESSAGVHKLYVASGNNVFFRDWTSSTDNGTVYEAYGVLGSLVLAFPGQLCEVQSITLEAVRVGSLPGVSVLLGEISGDFEALPISVQDPPQLPESQTLYSRRYYLNQSQLPVVCRHMQIRFDFGTDDAANELLSYSLYGSLHVE
jgi:hypothetical protein